ncbi:MAG: hypothetical protein JNJ54_29445 [Myxococcaceae bacterium]|nr:hypothetical protein [Myxococcaceae bacterium]
MSGRLAPFVRGSPNEAFLLAVIAGVDDALKAGPLAIVPLAPREAREQQQLLKGREEYWAGSPVLEYLKKKR